MIFNILQENSKKLHHFPKTVYHTKYIITQNMLTQIIPYQKKKFHDALNNGESDSYFAKLWLASSSVMLVRGS